MKLSRLLSGAFLLVGSLFLSCQASSTSGGAPAGEQKAAKHAPKSGESTGRGPTVVTATAAVFKNLTTDREVAGTVEAVVQSPVAPQISGVVSVVYRLAGDTVREGQPVFQIDAAGLKLSLRSAQTALANAKLNYQIAKINNDQNGPKLKLQVQSAQSSLDVAQKNYEASQKLLAIGGASANDVATANAQLQTAQANLAAANIAYSQFQDADQQTLAQLQLAIQSAQVALEQAQLNLDYATVRAPYAGQLSAVNVNPGQYVTPATQAFVLVGPAKQIAFNVIPSDAMSLTIGLPAVFTVSGVAYPLKVSSYPGSPVNGLVPMTAAPRTRIDVPYGVVGTVSYQVVVAKGDIIPVSALQSDGNVSYVFTVVDGKSVKSPITILGEAGVASAVSGLTPGVLVIDSPPPGLLDGAPIKVLGSAASAGKAAGGVQ
jgi:multidrug efflux pump subunit AcrA (membrane-fusion protein)